MRAGADVDGTDGSSAVLLPEPASRSVIGREADRALAMTSGSYPPSRLPVTLRPAACAHRGCLSIACAAVLVDGSWLLSSASLQVARRCISLALSSTVRSA